MSNDPEFVDFHSLEKPAREDRITGRQPGYDLREDEWIQEEEDEE